jgi:hypothetical protein
LEELLVESAHLLGGLLGIVAPDARKGAARCVARLVRVSVCGGTALRRTLVVS